jgi:hypothetical protein
VALDAFSPGLVFREKMIPLLRNEAEHEVHSTAGHVHGAFGMVSEERRLQIERVVREWIATIDEKAFAFRPGRISSAGFAELSRVLADARMTARLYERLISELKPSTGNTMMLSENRMYLSPRAD